MRFLGKATGDLYIKGICGIIFSEIYVEDCWHYSDTIYDTSTNPNISLVGLTDLEIEFQLLKSANNSIAYMELGENSNNKYLVGLVGSQYYDLRVYNNGSIIWNNAKSGLPNGTYNAVFTKESGVITWKCNNQTISTSDSSVNLNTIFNISCSNSGKIGKIKVKPL